MQNNSNTSALKIIAAVVLVILAALLCGSRSSLSPKSCVKLSEPDETVEQFFNALIDGRYDDCDAMLYNYSSLGLVSSSDTAMAQELYSLLRESYSYTILSGSASALMPSPSSSDVSASDAYAALIAKADDAIAHNSVWGKEASQAVAFTYLDISSISNDLHDRATEIAYSYAFNSIDINNEETAEKAVSEALDQLTDNISDYYRTDIFVIDMKYVDGEWRIVLEDSLYRAILGNIT